MTKVQKKFSAEFKAKVALAALQNQMTVAEIIEKFGVSKTMVYKWKAEASNAIEVLRRAVERHGAPEIINSDQGSQYTCEQWLQTAGAMGIKVSMDGRGRCRDNAWIERFWRTLKTEYVYLNPHDNASDMRDGIARYIGYYNERRPHSSLGGLTPQVKLSKTLTPAA